MTGKEKRVTSAGGIVCFGAWCVIATMVFSVTRYWFAGIIALAMLGGVIKCAYDFSHADEKADNES